MLTSTRFFTVSSLALLALAGAGCGEPEPEAVQTRALQVELVASAHGQTLRDDLTFALDDGRFRNALAELGDVADKLGRIEDQTAVEGVRVRVRVDGETLLERVVPAAAAPKARLVVDPFVAHLRAGQAAAESQPTDGVEVRSSALKAKVVIGKIWAFICGDCGSGADTGSGGGGGIRG